jgi:hypothetical protein
VLDGEVLYEIPVQSPPSVGTKSCVPEQSETSRTGLQTGVLNLVDFAPSFFTRFSGSLSLSTRRNLVADLSLSTRRNLVADLSLSTRRNMVTDV